MKRIAVFCGSSIGTNEVYGELAKSLGSVLVREGLGLVYGGASVGLMGIIADTVLAAGGSVTGVIPDFFSRNEIAHKGLEELIYVPSMHQRKLHIADISDGFIALPGGFGTLDELFEIITWGQLDLHRKPVGILNTNGYYDLLLQFVDNMFNQGFVREAHYNMLIRAEDPAILIERMRTYEAPDQSKWIDHIKA